MKHLVRTMPWLAVLLCAYLFDPGSTVQAAGAATRPRVVLTHDPELDDVNTLVRALLYVPDFRLEGLVYTSSSVHFRGDGKGTTQFIPGREYDRLGKGPVTAWRWPDNEAFIDAIVDAYGKVYANLRTHDARYPAPAELKSKINWGNVEFEGDYSQDTDGSNLIKRLLLDDQPGPLFVTAGGGQSTIARALKSIHDEYATTSKWEAIRNKVSRKLVIIPFGDQDSTNARYIAPNWPGVVSWRLDMINFGYGAARAHSAENQLYLGTAWTQANVSSRGPLGELYRVWGDGKTMSSSDPTDYFGLSGLSADELRARGYYVWTQPREKGSFISEGDTPTYMNLLENGLRAYEDGNWGGWGGRNGTGVLMRGPPPPVAGPDNPGLAIGLAPAQPANGQPATVGAALAGADATTTAATVPDFANRPAPVIPDSTRIVNERFFGAAQRDFAARLKWSVTPRFADANHAPRVTLRGPSNLTARPGDTIRLVATVSDPDRDPVKVVWWQYQEAGTYRGALPIANDTTLNATMTVPPDAKPGETVHVILEASDSGEPVLTRYQRMVITAR